MENIVGKLFEYDRMAMDRFTASKTKPREVFVAIPDGRLTGVAGLRGVGKTSWLLSRRQILPESLYVSCDLAFLRGVDFLEVARDLVTAHGIKTLLLDEVHFLPDWSATLKNIYDFLPLDVVFTGSSMLDVVRGSHDLSRRAAVWRAPIFSFREFLNWHKKAGIARVSWSELVQGHGALSKKLAGLVTPGLFDRYLREGQFGYGYDVREASAYQERLENSLKKSVYQDLPQFADVASDNLPRLEKALYFLAHAATGEMTAAGLAAKVGVTPRTADVWLDLLSRLGWIVRVPKYGTASDAVRKQEKIYFTSTNALAIFRTDSGDAGVLRETFAAGALYAAGSLEKLDVRYQSRTDFAVTQGGKATFLEVGGSSKSRADVLVAADGISVSAGNHMPLWMLGLLW